MSRAVLPVRAAVLDRLHERFPGFDAVAMRKCVDDLWACCEHLGVDPDTDVVERLAAARLTGVVKGSRLPRSGHCMREGIEEVNL